MVEVFKTNIQDHNQAILLFKVLTKEFPLLRINFDLDDCDKILRVEGNIISSEGITNIINAKGYFCQILE